MATSVSDLVLRLSAKDDTGPAFRSAADNADKLDRRLVDVDGSMQRLSRWGKAGALALGAGFVVAGAAAAKFGASAAMAASDFGEVSAAIEQTFGGQAAAELQAWAKSSASALGQSKTQALDAAKTFGVFGRAAGLTGTDLSGFAVDLTTLATDLASFNNSTPEAAIEAIGAGLRGESEPLRQFGVLLDDATLKARAMQMGIYDGTDSLTQQQRVLAAQAEIMAQTTLQQGDFARTQGGMANQLRETSGQWQNIKIAAGEALVPIAERYLPQLNAAMEQMALWIETHIPEIQAKFDEFVGLVESRFPAVQAQFAEIAETVRANWPQIKQTAEDIVGALQRVGEFSRGVWDAFQSLPEPVRETLMLAAVAQRTGALSISFKAADIVKDLFKSTVPVMNTGTINAGVVNGGAGGAAGAAPAAGKLGTIAMTVTGLSSVAAATTALGLLAAAAAGVAFATQQMITGEAIRKTNEMNGNVSTLAGTYATLGGATANYTAAELAARDAALAHRDAIAAANEQDAAAITRHREQGTVLAGLTDRQVALSAAIADTGAAAGVSAQIIGQMALTVAQVPPGASVDQLAQSIRDAGAAAGLSDEQIDALAASAYAVPGSANLPALKTAIDEAGRSGQWTAEQTNIMSAAVAAIPPGATAAQMGEAIRVAGVKAGVTDQQIQGVTAAVNAVPPTKAATITTNAPAEESKVASLSRAIAGLTGKTVDIGVKLSGSTGGGGTSTFAGGASGVGGWLDGQVDTLAERLAPTMATALSAGSYAGPGGGILGRPLSGYVVSSEFGPRNGTMHYGIDLAAPMGQGIFSAGPGLVFQAGWNGGYGNFVAVDHGNGYVTRYGHMSAIAARAGQIVGTGTLIGQVGSTGDSTGPHLHFETLFGGNFLNPRQLVALRHGGLVPTALSRGEYYVPESKAKGVYRLLSAVNAGVLSGPGTGTSDSIRALAKPGDFIVNARATKRHRGLLDAIVGRPQRLAGGGVVGGAVASAGSAGGGTTRVQLLIDGRALHESLIRYQRESGTADLFPVRA